MSEEKRGRRTKPTVKGNGGFLVAGTFVSETVIHQPGGGERYGTGGVAATIALALAEAGNRVTLVTSVGRGPEEHRAKEILENAPTRVLARESNAPVGQSKIITRHGEQMQANGYWPRQNNISRTVAREASNHDCIIADCNMTLEELTKILDHPGKLTMVNGTAARRAVLVVQQDCSDW